MLNQNTTAIEALKTAIYKFGERHPRSIRDFRNNERVMNQGEIGQECYLVKDGVLSVLVHHDASGPPRQVALRFKGDMIGETAFLLKNAPRTASVEVVSERASLITLDRKDLFGLIRDEPSLSNAVNLLWELSDARAHETLQIIDGHIKVESLIMSVMLADIHNFSALGEGVWEEHANAFLFDFIEQSEEIAILYGGSFEDQGDGFKVVFNGEEHADKSIQCALNIKQAFLCLRSAWVERNDAFSNIGLGLGICSDVMSRRKREGSPQSKGRVIGHAINVAAAISKYRVLPSDVEIFIDEYTAALLSLEDCKLEGPKQKWLDKLGRMYPIYRAHQEGAGIAGLAKTCLAKDGYLTPLEIDALYLEKDQPISILFLAADPSDASRLRLSEEAREIEEKLRLAKARDKFVFTKRQAVRPEDLSQSLLDVEPQIVHFSGHGTKSGCLCFEDKTGQTHPIPCDPIAALFREFSGTVKCVVLNACYSESQADAISNHIDYVIGMGKEIGDSAAIAFAVGVYQALGAGRSFEEAFRLGRVQIQLHGLDGEHLTPVLKKKIT